VAFCFGFWGSPSRSSFFSPYSGTDSTMAIPETPGRVGAGLGVERAIPAEASSSAVAWPAIIAGAFVAVAVSLLLLALGSGIGLSSLSMWSGSGASATTFTVGAAIWLIIVQWLASGLGGYLTGRLRTKWVDLHTHEVFFRDTAHGFLTWAVASVIGVAVLGSAVSSVISGSLHGAAGLASGVAQGASQAASQGIGQSSGDGTQSGAGYYIDSLFRSDHPSANASNGEVRSEAGRILAMGLRNGDVPAADKTYLAQLVAARTGLSQADAQKRVDDVIAQEKAAEEKARQAADKARKAASSLAFFTFFSMLIGAFIASAAAAFGGRQRDEY
jgi:hypothetical protein